MKSQIPKKSSTFPSSKRGKSRCFSVIRGMAFNSVSLVSLFFFLIISFFLPTKAQAQNQVQIIEADSIVGGQIQGAPVQKILGNVHLRSEDMDMYADSAYKFDNREMVQAFGNIEIDTRQEHIFADTLTYYTDIDFSELRGRVIIEADSSTLYGNEVDYRFTNKVAHFLDEIRLEDQQGVLKANTGFYFRRADSATFRGQVQLRDSLKYIEGDSLFSNRQSEYYELHGKVFADDPENDSMLKGDYLEADSTGRRLIKGNAWLKNYKEDSSATAQPDSLIPTPPDSTTEAPKDSLEITPADSLIAPTDSTQIVQPDTSKSSQPDTTHIQAATILSLQNRMPDDTTTTVKAYKNVRIWSPDFSSLSDTANYESEKQTFELWSNAKAWHKQIQLTGPYIWVKLQNGDIKQLDSYPNPFTIHQDTLIHRLNQIKGDTLKASFIEGELRLIRVIKNSHLLRFTRSGKKPDGVIELVAPVTNIFFENGELIELKAIGNHNGNYLPESKEVADKKLDGFSWNPEQRPQRPARVMKPRFPPIPKKPLFELPKRYLQYIGKTDSLQIMPPDTSGTPTDTSGLQTDSTRSENFP